jgi:DNA modification methylase
VRLDTLKPFGRVLRKRSEKLKAQLLDSVAHFGQVFPIVIDGQDEVIAGHGILEAMRQAGYAHIGIVRLTHLSGAQKRALRIALNRLGELSGWDEELLALEFKELLEMDLTLELDFDLAITGFSAPEIDRFIEIQGDEVANSADDEQAVDQDGAPVSELGDIFLLGEHRIACGDSRLAETYSRLLGSERPNLGIHDSPYNVKINGHVSKSGKHREFVMATGEMSSSEFTSFLTEFLRHAARVSAPGAIQFAFMDWRHMEEMLVAGREAGLNLRNLCVWNKGSGGLGSAYRSQHELVFMFHEPGATAINNVQLGRYQRNRSNVWDFLGAPSLRKELELHSTPKPVSLVAEAIRDCSHRNDIVLDCFSGSGTTIIAAAKTGRRARVIELDPHYVDVAVRRWERWSGEVARHGSSGLTFAELGELRRKEPASVPIGPPRPRVRTHKGFASLAVS